LSVLSWVADLAIGLRMKKSRRNVEDAAALWTKPREERKKDGKSTSRRYRHGKKKKRKEKGEVGPNARR